MEELVGEYVARFRVAGMTGVPCTEDEVSALEQELGIRLPASYRAMLLLMGREPDENFIGTDLAMRWLRELQSAARELLEENGRPFELPCKAFVFLMHQGYQFMYFIVDDSDDPPVYHYVEGSPTPKLMAQRLSDWFCVVGAHS